MACGDGIVDCGAFGACGDFAGMCDESGTQSRACTDTRTDHTCANQSCGTSVLSLPDQSCSRDTECNSCLTVPGGQPGSCSPNGTCGAQCR